MTIGFDRLKLILTEFVRRAERRHDWIAPVGLCLPLLLTLVAADFHDKFGFSAQQWEAVALTSLLAGVVWFGYSIRQYFLAPSVEHVLTEIIAKARLSRQERALFIIKASSDKNVKKFLVYRDGIWNAYLFPHAPISSEELSEDSLLTLGKNIANYLGLDPAHVKMSYIEGADLRSLKHSEFQKQDTSYHFRFVHVMIDCKLPYASKKKFQFAGRTLAWMSTEEMEADINTARKNIDVIRHLRDHYDLFFNVLPDSIDDKVP